MSIASIVQKNPSHDLRGNPKKMGPVLPARFLLINKLEISLVYEGSRLQSVVRIFVSHIVVCEPTELTFNQWQQLIKRSLIAIAPINKKACYLG
jgi:hypothetical protein